MKDYKLPKQVYSRAQVLALAEEAKKAADSARTKDIKQKYTNSRPQSKPKTSYDLREFMSLNKISPQDFKTASSALADIAKSAPRVTCTLPVMPAQNHENQLAEWFREQVHPLALLTIHVDRTILGGAVVRGRNSSWDFSVRRMFAAREDALEEVVSDAR